jgi:hypothetical protein
VFSGSEAQRALGVRSPGFTFALAPQALMGDWNGDGRTDVGWYDNGHVTLNVNGSKLRFTLGRPGDRALAGDWDGDGTTTIGVYRPEIFTFLLRNSNTSGEQDVMVGYGTKGDSPVVGDWDGK